MNNHLDLKEHVSSVTEAIKLLKPEQLALENIRLPESYGASKFDIPGESAAPFYISPFQLSPEEALTEQRAQRQSSLAKLGSGFTKGIAELPLGVARGFSVLLDPDFYEKVISGSFNEYTNSLSDAIGSVQQELEEALPVYRTQASQGFSPGSSGWWADLLPSIIESASLMIPGYAITRGLSLLGKAAGGTKLLKTVGSLVGVEGKALGEGLSLTSMASLSRMNEQFLQATDAAKNWLIDNRGRINPDSGNPYTEEELKSMSGEIANQTFYSGLPLATLDMLQLNIIFKGFKGFKEARRLATDKSIGNLIKPLATESTVEALDEAIQFIQQKEAEYEQDIKTTKVKESTFEDRLTDYLKDGELWTSAFAGGLGGLLMYGGGRFLARKENKIQDRTQSQAEDVARINDAVIKGNKQSFDKESDITFAKAVIQHIQDGTIDDFRDNLEKLSKTENEFLTGENFNDKNFYKRLQSRIQSLDTIDKAFYDIQNDDTVNNELKPIKLATIIDQRLTQNRINHNISDLQELFNDDIKSGFNPNLTELKKLQAEYFATLNSPRSSKKQKEIVGKKLDQAYKNAIIAGPKFEEIDVSEAKDLLSKDLVTANDNQINKLSTAIHEDLLDIADTKKTLDNIIKNPKQVIADINTNKAKRERIEKLKPKTKATIEGKEVEGELWTDNKGQSYLKVKKSPTEFSSYPIEQKDGIWTQKITEPVKTVPIEPTVESIANKITKAESLTSEEEDFRRTNAEAIETKLQELAKTEPIDIEAKKDRIKELKEQLRDFPKSIHIETEEGPETLTVENALRQLKETEEAEITEGEGISEEEALAANRMEKIKRALQPIIEINAELAALETEITPTTLLPTETPEIPVPEDTVNQQSYPEDSAKSIFWNKTVNSKDDSSKPSNERFYRFVEKTKKSELKNYKLQVVTKINNPSLYSEILDSRKNEKDIEGRNARQFEEEYKKETENEYQGVYLLIVDNKGNPVLKDNQYIFSTFPRVARAIKGETLLTNKEIDAALLFRIHLLEQTKPTYLPIIDKSEGFPQFEVTIKGERQYFSLKDRFTVQSLELLTLEISDKPGQGKLKNGQLGQTGKLYAHDSEGHIIDLIPRKLTIQETDKVVDLIKQQLGLIPKTVENTSKELNKLIYFRVPEKTSTHTLGINKDKTLQLGNTAIPFDETKLRDFLTNTKRVNVNNIDFSSEFTDIFGTKHPTYQHYLTEGENPLFQTDLLPTSQVQYRNQYLIFDPSIKPFTTKETKTPVKNKKPLIKKDRKTLDRLKTLETNTRIPISDEEREWFKSNFPNIPIETIQGLIENKALGRFLNSGRLLLSDQATAGTLYHESFHVTTQLYLTPEELNRLYREAKEKTTAKSDLEAEEILAEDFFNYKKTGLILSDRPARNTIFKRLLNFIKDLLNLPASSIEDIYRRLNKGFYTNRPVVGVRQFSKLDRSKISEEKGVAFEAEAISNIGALYYDHLFKGSIVNGEFIIRTPSEVTKEISVDIYNEILTTLEEKREAEENSQISDNIDYIYYNLDELFDLFIEKNKIKGIEITTEEFEEEIDETEETTFNKTYQEANEVSTRSQINDQVWELITSLKQKNSDGSDKLSEHTNLPQLVNSSSLYNFLLRQLAGLSTYEEMIEKIDKLAYTRPTLTELLDRLGEPSVTARPEQQILQDQFRQDFGKTYTTSYKTVLKEDGTVYFTDANTELSAGRILEKWKNNIITKTVQTEEGKLILNLDSIHFTNVESFLDSVGFNFSEEGLKAAKEDDNFQTSIVAIQNYIKERKGDITTLFEPTREEREARTDVKGRLTYLAALEADNSPDTAELSFVSSTGKTIFAIGNNSTLSITINKINKANTLSELYTDLPHLNTVSTEGSAWLNELFDATGKRRPNKKFTIALQDGVSNDADSLIDFESPTARLTSGDKWVQEINSILNGRSSLIRTSDKKSEFTVFMDKPLFSIEELKTLDNERLKEVIKGYFKSELKRIALHRTLGIGKDRDKIDEHGDKFTALQDIVSADMKKAINAELDTIKDVSPEELLTRIDELAPTFYTDLDTRTIQFFTAYANEIKHEFTSHNITKSIGISTAFKKYPLEQLINAIIVNDFISSVEQTKLIFGDMVFYSDFFKRTAGFTGTRLTLANGNQINEWLNHNFKRKDKKVEDGTANIAIFEDVIVSVQQEILDSWANSLIEATKITKEQADEILKPYTEITEGDAQGWITLDEWRNIMFRMGNPIPQEVFEKAQKGEILDPEEVIYFTPMKLLYAGPQKYDYFYVPAYHKFSLFPLLPSMVADKNIRKLMNTMTNQQVGYALFRSGSKVGTPVKEGKANAFYTEDGKINTENWQKQVIYYDFLGEQVKASDPVLEYTFGSQPKKLLFGGLFEEGKPINKHVGDLLGQFNSTINDIVQEEKEKLIKDLGINPESYKSKDIKALLKLLRDEAKRRDLPDNLIESLQSEIINGKEVLKNKFDAQVNKIKIDSMLMSLVNSRLIRQKVLGDALVQVSSSGMEPAGKRKIETDKTLKFYRQDPLTGRTLPAEIMLAINLKDPSHQLLLEQYGTLEKLNSAIKKGKVDKEALQIIAYRIPTQGHNSMEFFEIVEFLPAESSTAMIVPTEIVAKAGSDFDIDKLFILKFNSRLLKLTKKQIAQNKIMNIAKEVLSMKEVFPSLITPNSSKILSDIADEIRFINKLNEDPDPDLIRSKFETKEQYEEAFNKKRKEYTASRKRAEEKNILYTGQLKLSGKNGKIAQFIRFLTAKNMIGIVALQNTHNILAQQHNLTIDGKQAEINLPHNKVSIQPEVEAISNFLGYRGGFEGKGKGTPQGDGKDKAMRSTADGFIGERSSDKPSSTLTSYQHFIDTFHYKGQTLGKTLGAVASEPNIVMLARNGALKGTSLSESTKKAISNAQKAEAEFIVGDMPDVDSQFIDYLQEIGAKFTIYHTGTTPRIKVEEVTKPTTEKADISISKLKDVENKNSISEVISQTITATVDAANDPFMFDINMNMETLPIIQYLTRSGTSFPIIGYFMSQPIINEYLKESSVHRSGFLRVTKNNKFRNQVLASVKEKYGKQSKDYTVKIFSAEELKNNLFKENQTSQEFKDQQLQILDDFLSYQTQAQFLSDAMRATNMDTWGVGKNLNLIQNKLNLIEKVKAQGFVKGIDRILEKSLIKSFNQLEFTQDIFGQFYYTQSPEFVKVKQDITNSIPVLGKKAEEQLATLIENDLINFIVQNHGYPNIVAYKDALFKSKPVAKELQRIKTNPKDEDEIKLSQNFFIRQLQPLISARKGDMNNIKLYTRRYDTFLADQLTEAFREIKELNPDLAKQIMDLGILQSGLNNSPITYLGLIPYEYYNDITKQAFEKFNSQPLEKREEDLQQFEKLFLENNTIKTKAGLKLRQKKGWIFYKNYIKPITPTEGIEEIPEIEAKPSKINFQEEPTEGYETRTRKNASADATIHLAIDFETISGEKLTYGMVNSQAKKYIPLNLSDKDQTVEHRATNSPKISIPTDNKGLEVTKERVDKIVEQLNSIKPELKVNDTIIKKLIENPTYIPLAYSLLGVKNLFIDYDKVKGKFGSIEKRFAVKIYDLVVDFRKFSENTFKDIISKEDNDKIVGLLPLIEQFRRLNMINSLATTRTLETFKEQAEIYKKLNRGLMEVLNPYMKKYFNSEIYEVPLDIQIKKEEIPDYAKQKIEYGISLNIAGNGIYTMKGKYTQQQVDDFTYELLKAVVGRGNIQQFKSSQEIYSKLGNKTQSKNVIIKPSKVDIFDYWKQVKKENPNGAILAYRGKPEFEKSPFYVLGNPIEWKNLPGTREQQGIEATKQFIDGVINSDKPEFVRIRDLMKSGELKNKFILYYDEKNYATHATALDYLINKYDWSKQPDLIPQYVYEKEQDAANDVEEKDIPTGTIIQINEEGYEGLFRVVNPENDDIEFIPLKAVIDKRPELIPLKTKIESIRTGGQTGIDESGAKAGVKLGIPTTILAPKGWTFRDITGRDISNEQQFKARFKEIELKKKPSLIKPITEIFYSEAKKDDFIRDLSKDYPKEIIEERKIREGMWRVTVDKKDIEEYKEKYAEAVAEEVRKEEEETEKYIKKEKEIEEERKLAEGLELSLLPDDVAIGKAIFKEIIDKLNAKYSENYKLSVVPPLEALKLLKETGHTVEYTIHTAPAFYIAEDKTMVFPTNFLTTEVAFHEFAHPFVDAITEQNKPLFYNLKSQLSNPENASGQLIINEVIKEYSGDLGHVKDGKLTEKGWKEAIVTAIGRMAKNQLNESKDKGLIAALKQLLKRIGSYLQSLIDDPTKIIRPVEIDADTTLEELAAMLNLENKIEITPEMTKEIELKKRTIPETPEKEPAFKKQYVYFTRRLALLEKRQERFEKGTVNYNLIEEEKAAITKAIQEENYIEVSNETLNKVKEFITVLEKGESLTDDNIKFISDVLDVFRDFSSGQEENIASETLKLEKQLFPIIENFYLQQIKEHSTEPFEITKELVDAQNEDIGKVRLYTGSLLDTDNYIARTIGGIIRTAQNKRQTRDKQLKSKIEEERKLLESWAKKNGVTLSAAYDIFIQSKRGSTTLTQQFLETGEPNPNWTKIQKTPELLRFYNFYKTTITELQKDQLAKPGKYFIPNIESKTTWEKITSIVEKKTDISESIAINEELYADILAARYLKKVPEEKKSRDLSAILMAYGQHTNNYEEMSEILPTIRILQKGLQYKIINGKVEERSFKKPSDPKELVFGRNSNLNSMIDQVIDMQVFGKMRKPEAKFMESPIYDEEGKQTGTQYRLASDYMDLALKYNSLLRIGFSPITAGANWLFGDITNLIEAIGGRFFTLKGLQQASNIFVKQNFDRNSVLNKILIEELNILQDLEDYHHISDVSLAPVKKLSPEKLQEYAYAMQKGGEKWLQSRTAIAIMLKEGYITPNGTLTEKFTKAEQKEKQQLVDKIQRLNQMIHGRYTQQEAAIAQQYILYRMVIQFKKWLPAAIETRFGSKQWDVRLQVEIEGRYRTFWRMLRNITDSVNRLSKGKLTELELYNMKKNLSEIVLWTATILLYSMGRGDDDEAKKLRKNWAWKTAMLLTNRVSGDISFFFDPSQMAYTAKNAIPLIRTFDDARLALTYLPLALSEEGKYKVGSRKGQSKFLTKAAGITVGLKPISDIRRIIRERELEELR